MLRRLGIIIYISGFLAIFSLFIAQKTLAVYDPLSVANNRYGIHILNTSELGKAAELVNSSGGDWGYVTIPIQANDRDLKKWTQFMNDARSKHLIPILRIASFPVEDHWMAPNEYDLVDFANFLDELPWPTKNRYVIVYNEPNHKNEWGGFVYPEEYAQVLSRAVDIFHKRNADFFVISAGLDSSSPDGPDSLNEYSYLRIMNASVPGIFNAVDGISSHSYGNPGFSAFPNIYSRVNIANYRFEENLLSTFGINNPKLFITEAGWRNDLLGDTGASNFYRQAFGQVWTDANIVAVTPFLLSSVGGPFDGFSFTNQDGSFKNFSKDIQALPKTDGQPELALLIITNPPQPSPINQGAPGEAVSSPNLLLQLFSKVKSLFGGQL